jgi:tRNA (guanine37-N1)-methyltransferase
MGYTAAGISSQGSGRKMHLKVRKSSGEAMRQKLISAGVLDYSRRIMPDGDFILIPVSDAIDIPGAEIVEVEGVKMPKRTRSLKDALKDKLTEDELISLPTSFDVIGDIAVLELTPDLVDKRNMIGEALLETFHNLKVVAEKMTRVDTEYRTRGLDVVAGEDRKVTVHREQGCLYKLNVETAYFSPRLGFERLRVASQVKDCERVLVMFAGVGPYAILIAKNAKPSEVYAIELNPEAFKYMVENIRLNKVDVKPILGDAGKEVKVLGKFDRIVMPLPKDAGSFLDSALPALNPNGIIHLYDFSSGEEESKKKAVELCKKLGYEIKVLDVAQCGSYAPDTGRFCVDFQVI